MSIADLHNLGWILSGCYVMAIVSALLPWVNAEVLTLSASPFATSRWELSGIVLAVALGQMTGKSVTYWLSRSAAVSGTSRLQRSVERWGARVQHRPCYAMSLMFLSAVFGIPPFYVVAVAAGALRFAFGPFLAVGTVGRLLHFGIVAFVPQLLWRAV